MGAPIEKQVRRPEKEGVIAPKEPICCSRISKIFFGTFDVEHF